MWTTWITTEEKLIMAMHNPPHPGGIVKRQCLKPLGLTVSTMYPAVASVCCRRSNAW